MSAREAIRQFVAARHESQARFLASLVKIPSDNPPGHCKPHAEAAARLLHQFGFAGEPCPGPQKPGGVGRVRHAWYAL